MAKCSKNKYFLEVCLGNLDVFKLVYLCIYGAVQLDLNV